MCSRPNQSRTRECSLLLVDDDQLLLNALGRLLRRRGVAVTTATNAEMAMILCAADHFALVLTDQNMAGASGLSLLEQLRREQPDVRRALMSALEVPELGQHLRSGTVEYWLPKDSLCDEALTALLADAVGIFDSSTASPLQRDSGVATIAPAELAPASVG